MSRPTHRLSWSLACCAFTAFVANARAADPSNVLLVINDSSAVSQAIGAYYAGLRAIPAENQFHLPVGTTTAETVDRPTFNGQVRDPLIQYLSVTQPHLKDQIRYIVLTKYVPLRITGSTDGYASVESELCLLFTGLLGDTEQVGWINNPYFQKDQSFASFSSATLKYLVCRLDGYETPVDAATGVPVDVKGILDRAQSPATSGMFLLDQDASKSGAYAVGNQWMSAAATALAAVGQPYTLEPSTTFVANAQSMLGYASWGSNDCCTAGPPYYGEVPIGSGNHYPGSFVNGALATTYVSTSGRTFLTSQATYGQSLIADLIRLGVTGANGHVFEPYLNAIARPQVLFPRFLAGYDAIEAFYMSIPYLSWQNTIVVDPLMKSGVIATLPPTVTFQFPVTGDHTGGTVVTLVGSKLGAIGTPLTVRFNGIPSQNAQFLGVNYITVVTPAGLVGPTDIEVTVPNGTVLLDDAFLFLPAVTGGGATPIGQTSVLTITGKVGDSYALFAGAVTASLPAAPHGTLLLDPAFMLLLLSQPFPAGAPSTTLALQIPNDPGLVGLTAWFQAAVGNLLPGSPATYFTNRAAVTVGP